MPDQPPPRKRRLGWWILLGAALGAVLTIAILLLPPVQGWLLRRLLAQQAWGQLDFQRVAVTPGGAEAADLKLRLPNLSLEARALRVAISPWQLLSRRRLAIADLEARSLAIRAVPAPANQTSAPFSGVLDSLEAPLAWACSRAEADGDVTFEQPGGPPLHATFRISGRDLDIRQPGRLAFELTAPGETVAGFTGTWRLAGTLDFVPGADGRIARLAVDCQATPAAHAAWKLPVAHFQFNVTRKPDGETYTFNSAPEEKTSQARVSFEAAFRRATHELRGQWSVAGDSALATAVLQRGDLPTIDTATEGTFACDTASGDLEVVASGRFSGHDWKKLRPELADVAPLEGRHRLALARHADRWTLRELTANAGSPGSDAAVTFTLDRPVTLPPGEGGDTQPWGTLRAHKIPLAWAAPLLGVPRIQGGELAGAWKISSPNVAALRFTPDGPLTSTALTVALPDVPPNLALQAAATLEITATAARVDVRDASLQTPASDRIAAELDATADLEKLTGKVALRWQASLPTWLGGAQAPKIQGRAEALLRQSEATLTALRVAVLQTSGADAFTIESLAPITVPYARPDSVQTAEGDLLRISAHDLQLDWGAALLPGFSLSGTLTGGESILRRKGRSFIIAAAGPWTFRDLLVAQGGLTLLRAPRFEFQPQGRVQLDENWVPQNFTADFRLSGVLDEIFRIRDPDGALTAKGSLNVVRFKNRLQVRTLELQAVRSDQTPLLELQLLQPVVLGVTAKDNEIENAADTLLVRTAALPLPWLQPYFPAGWEATGTLEPAEFRAKIDLPNLHVSVPHPLGMQVKRLTDGTNEMLRDVRVEFSPTTMVLGQFCSFVVDNGRLLLDGREAGTAGIGLLYFTKSLQIPISAKIDLAADVARLRDQPIAGRWPLPPTGQARFFINHDLTKEDQPSTATFLLSGVRTPDGKGTLPRFGLRLTQLRDQNQLARVKLEFQYQTEPTWSAFVAEMRWGMDGKRARLEAGIEGDYFDVGQFATFVGLLTPATPAAPAPKAKAAPTPAPPDPAPASPPTHAFWRELAGHFDLKFGRVVYAPYEVTDITGAFDVDDTRAELRNLSGKMFDGTWRGQARLDFDAARGARPYRLAGEFGIENFSAEKIVQSAYPSELGSFSGRLNFHSKVEGTGAMLPQLLDESTSEFDFRSEGGHLRLNVPHSTLASSALLVGGAVTFSPELRAIGRLVKKLSDLPVDEISAHGRRGPDGGIAIEDFKLTTPQLRLSGRAQVPPQADVALAARKFEMPVTLAARDEMAVLLQGMKLVGRKPDADGYFTMTRHPTLRGTLGAPDTTDLYDTLAQAVAGSSGTFGFLMKKVQQQVEESRAASGR